MENVDHVVMPFSDLGQTNAIVSESQDLSAERFPLGFMDLLGVHCYALTHEPPMSFPAIPNSSSTEALTGEEKKRGNHEEEEDDDDGEEQKLKRNKRFKLTKNSEETKMRAPKVSFITKSEVLHLEDGYKWRKYGQKPVKNSPFPRNYYRCTTSWCDVKKRVERSFTDPSTVITTYEGQHTHPSPLLIMPKRSSFRSINGLASVSHFGLPTLPPQLFHYNNQHQQQQQQLSFSGTRYLNNQENGFTNDHHVVKKLVKDHGLLEDVVSPYIIKEEHLVNRIMK